MKTNIQQPNPSLEIGPDNSGVAASVPATSLPLPLTSVSAPASLLPDPFDPLQFAASSSIFGEIGVRKELVTCDVRKPNKQEFVRVHPGPEYRLRAHLLEIKEERESYLVMPSVAAELPGETRTVSLRLCVTRQGAVFLWPVPESTIDGRETAWSISARAAAAAAETEWIRVIANMAQGAYDVHVAGASPLLGTPIWPDKSLRDILAVAFGESFIIRDGGHPIIKRLLGLV